MKYYATVRFVVGEIVADDIEGVEKVLNKLIDQLGDVETDVRWDDVDWIVYEEEI